MRGLATPSIGGLPRLKGEPCPAIMTIFSSPACRAATWRCCGLTLKRRGWPRGTILFQPGEDIELVHFPTSGVVSVLEILRDGAAVECSTLGAETAFGLLAAREPARSFSRDIVQIGGGLTMSAARLRAACAASPTLATTVDRHLRVAMSFMAQSVACNARHKLEARLCRWILTCADYVEGNLLPLTQEFIASMLGVQRTSVTAAAAGLQQSGVLRVARGKVTVLDAASLAKRSCECYESTRALIDASLGRPAKRPPLDQGVRRAA